MRFDPYDVRVAFSDLFEQSPLRVRPIAGMDVHHAASSVLRKAKRKHLAFPVKIAPVNEDTTVESFQVLGADPFDPGVETVGLPVFAAILRFFTPPPSKLVRDDSLSSYGQFRETRCTLRLRDLDKRLRALEERVLQHAMDRPAERFSVREDAFDEHLAPHRDTGFGTYSASDVLGARQSEDIPVVRALRGKVECWQDGDEVCCTVRFKNQRGDLRLATAATPSEWHLEEVLDCASGAELEALLPVLGRLVQVLGSIALIPELCRAVLILSTRTETSPMIGLMTTQGNRTMSAAMALLQCCQKNDARAWAEVRALQAQGADHLLAEAAQRLTWAQRDKAARGVIPRGGDVTGTQRGAW